MGWFDEQIKERIKNDEAAFQDAFATLADTVMNKRLAVILNDNSARAKNAIDEILNYYRVKSRELPNNIKDINDQLEYIMHPLGIMRRNVRLSGKWYKEAFGAMLAILKDDGKPIALIPGGFSGYVFLDYKTGKYVKVNKNNAKLIDENAIYFYKPLPLEKITLKDLWKYMIGNISKYDILNLCTAAFASAAVGLLIPKINNIIYAYVVIGNSLQVLFKIFAFLLSVGVSQILITAIQKLLSAGVGNKMSSFVHTAIMMRLLSLPSKFFKKQSSGELASIVINIGNYISVMVDAALITGISAIFSAMYIIQMFRYGKDMAVAGLMVILFTFIFGVICTMVDLRIGNEKIKLSAHEEGLIYSLITGVQKIKLSGAEKRAFAKWAAAYKSVAQLNNNPPLIVKLGQVVPVCAPLIGTIVIYYFAIKSNVNVADYFAFNSAYGLVMGAFSTLVGVFHTYAQIKPTLNATKTILEAEPELAGTKTVVSRLMGGIEINNLSFKYTEDMPYVLDNLSLKIRPGQYVAIVGESGCGKSTLIRLMLGFEKPNRGAIYYDGKDIASLDLKSLRKNIGTVMQNEKLFQGDIFSNITISLPRLTMDEAWQAAEMAGIAENIKSMPMGMHTIISEGSGGISGGQKQRIIIARAIASKPKILMFDEATSALDNITQKTVSDSLKNLKCTRVVIAHRLSTIKNCDRIIVLDKGKIIEDGKYDELISQNGFFSELVKRQQLDK